jgi:hypothetical protein
MTLPELQSCLDRLGVKLSLKLVVDAPARVISPEIKAALATHKPRLLVLLAHLEVHHGPPTTSAPASLSRSASGPVSPTWPERGPRDFRRGDRWLPWHFADDPRPEEPAAGLGEDSR